MSTRQKSPSSLPSPPRGRRGIQKKSFVGASFYERTYGILKGKDLIKTLEESRHKDEDTRIKNSGSLYQQAVKVIPGGVNSPVRAFKAVGGDPIFVKKGKGPWIWDEEGRRYLDFCCSWGALLFGHAPPSLISRVSRDIKNGISFGIATRKEVELAEAIRNLYPSMEMLRLVSSGTEAVMSAIRLARGFTGRNKIVKIDGGYHGHVDSLLVKAGSGSLTLSMADSAGVPEALARETLSIPFNDTRALENVFEKYGKEIAALVIEPVPANMGVVLPAPGYLEACRQITKKYGALLLFDEVITGFRMAAGGAQEFYGIQPDLTCLGKILGGGFPIAAFGGCKEMMEKLAPLGPVYQAGTLSGNPAAVSAALWTLKQISQHVIPARPPKISGRIRRRLVADFRRGSPTKTFGDDKVNKFYSRLREIIQKSRAPVQLNAAGSMFTIFFTPDPVTDFVSAKKSDTQKFAAFFHHCLKRGIYLSPAQFETNFVSLAHTPAQLGKFVQAFEAF